MRFLVLLFLAISLWGQKKPEVQMIDVKAHRIEDGKIAVDGRVQVTADKPIRGLTVVFDFLSADGDPLVSQKVEVDEDIVNPGEEASFHAVALNTPGAVRCRIRVFNATDKQLRAANTGPFTIE